MKAKLVTFEFVTRVIVDDNATTEEIMKAGVKDMAERLLVNGTASIRSELVSNYSLCEDDVTVPYDPAFDFEGKFGFHPRKPS